MPRSSHCSRTTTSPAWKPRSGDQTADRLVHAPLDFAAIDRKLVAVELADFAAAIAAAYPPEVDGHIGLRNMAAIFAVAESHVAGAPVAVDAVLTGDIHAYQDPIDAALGLWPTHVPLTTPS